MVTSSLTAPVEYFLLDVAQSQEIDRRTINEMGIDGFTLMEVAGSSAAKKLLESGAELTHGIYLCGKGNNGGDALVIARYLIQHNIKATVVFLSGTNNLSPDADENLQLLQNFASANQLTVIDSWDNFSAPSEFDFIIDGMLGTGLDSDVRGDYTNAVEWANGQSQPTFAVDIPTGLHANSGKIMGCAVSAERTFSFGSRKQGFYLNGGPDQTGTVHYCELPFPNAYKETCNTFLLDKKWVSIKERSPGEHKYDAGVLYIIAGSEGLTGAAIMAAQSAWAEGLGAVILICPRALLPIYEQTLPSIIKKPVGNRDDYFFKQSHVEDVLAITREKEGSVLLGPGLGRDNETVKFVEQFTSQNEADTVVDADGLWGLSQLAKWEKPEQSHWILTPHPGELQQLTGKSCGDDSNRLSIVRNFAQSQEVTILSKGMPGVLGTPAGNCYLTNYNTRFFGRAGSGDILAGKTSAFLALGYKPDYSAANALLHGKKKLDDFLEDHQGLPEPKDFI